MFRSLARRLESFGAPGTRARQKSLGQATARRVQAEEGDEAGWITFYLGQARLSSVMKQSQQQAHAAQRNKSFRHTQVTYDFQVLIGAYLRVFQMQTLTPCCKGDGAGVELNQVMYKVIGMLGFDAESLHGSARTVFEIESYDDVGAATDCGGKDMPVILVWQV